jgi:uncharacterized membrane protein
MPAGMIALALIPVAAGMVRLTQLGGGGQLTAQNARFYEAPIPVVLHIVTATIYSLLGALQFVPGFRLRQPDWHRVVGRILVGAGLVAALSGLWMALFYAIVPADSALLHGFRLFFGLAMACSISLGYLAIRRGNVARHQDWMCRAYAIGLGAGTQAVTQLPLLLLYGAPNASTLAWMMGGAWMANLATAQWFIRKRRSDGCVELYPFNARPLSVHHVSESAIRRKEEDYLRGGA